MSGKPSIGGRLALRVFMVIVMWIGVSMMIGTVRDFMESQASMSWPTAVGNVTRSEMRVHEQKLRRRSSDGIRRTSTNESYEAEIEYEFKVDGTTHKGNRQSAVQGGQLADKGSVVKKLAKYPVGQAVKVSYNPANPSQCVLEPGSWGGFVVMAGLSLFLILISSVVLWVAWGPNASKYISGL